MGGAGRPARGGMRQVAQLAGVSVSTVANVLNNPGLVAEDTRQRVLEVMARVGFVRSGPARQLRGLPSRLVGVVTLDQGNPFYAALNRGIEDGLADAGCVTLTCSTDVRADKETSLLRILEEQAVRGILITPTSHNLTAILEVSGRGTPVVLVDGPNGCHATCAVTIDHRRGGELVGAHLVALGHRRLAYVPGDVNLWPNLSGGEVIDLLGRLRGGLDPQRRAALLERFDLDPTKKGRTYSKGNRQKVALVAALASDVELLILDEPTSGLDPLMEATFRACINEERADGRTVLLSSHILSEVEALCDRVSIIRAGKVVDTGTLAQMRHLSRTSITAELASPVDLAAVPGVHDVVAEGQRVTFDVDNAELDAVMRRLAEAGVRSLTSQPPTLEELFLRHYTDDLVSS